MSKHQQYNSSERAAALQNYFNSPALLEAFSEKIKSDLIEGKKSLTYVEIQPPSTGLEAGWAGTLAEDQSQLKLLEGKLKSTFSIVNHVRFGNIGDIIVDTKQNTWFRRNVTGTGPDYGGP